MNSSMLLLGIIAGAVVLLGAALVMRRRAKLNADDVMERMGRFATRDEFLSVSEGSGGRNAPNKAAQTIEGFVKGKGIAGQTATLLSRADVRMTVGEFLLIRVGSAAVGFAIGFVLLSRVAPSLGVLLGLATAFLGYVMPTFYLSFKAKRRRKQFVNQLGDTITLMANSLRAGYSLLQTMDMVSKESADPMATEFRRVVREIGLGISNQEAMDNLLRRIPSDDLDLLVTAINIQHEVGGNLAQILTTIGHTIRERVRIKGEIGVLTAQVQISGYIISGMPIGLAGLIFMLNPDYILGLFVWPYICMPIAALVMIVMGFFIMKKITAIEV